MAFKGENNAGKRLVFGNRWPGKHTLWLDMVSRIEDAPLLAQRDRWPDTNNYTDAQLKWLGGLCSAYIYKRMVWRSDSETRGKIDVYFSRLAALIFGKATEYGDCDDFAVTWLEAMLLWGADPARLVFIQVLTKNGQKALKYGRSKAQANHNIAGVILDNGDVQIIDSNEARTDYTPIKIKPYKTGLLLSETDHKVYMGHRISDPDDEWHIGVMQ